LGWTVLDGLGPWRSGFDANAFENDRSELVTLVDVSAIETPFVEADNLADFVAVERGLGVGGKGENTVLSGGP